MDEEHQILLEVLEVKSILGKLLQQQEVGFKEELEKEKREKKRQQQLIDKFNKKRYAKQD